MLHGKKKDFVYLAAILLFFVIIFYNIVFKDNEDQRRKELRMKYYL
jgi:hypothetical protein